MSPLKNILVLFFLLFASTFYAQEMWLDLDLKNVPLEEVIHRLEVDNGLLFSYKEEDVQGIIISTPSQALLLSDFLAALIKGTTLDFEIVKNNYVILSQKNEETGDYKWPLISGRVVDSLTGEPLSFANIYIQKTRKGIAASADGFFQWRTKLEFGDTLVISYVGYQEKRLSAKAFDSENKLTIPLSYLGFGNELVLVTDYLTDGINLNNNGTYLELRPERIGALPGQVEPDVLNTIQFLPGVSSVDGTASGIHIRGGTPDQNLILWEDIPIYHAAHYFGMISAFNPYVINKVDVYRGGFDAEYGGRISGLIDLKSEHHTTSNQFGLGTNFLNGYTNGKVSFLKNKVTFIYSLRHSLSGIWRTPTFENITNRIHQGVLLDIPNFSKLPSGIKITDQFDFFDSNLKATYQITEKDEFSAAWFYGKNDFSAFIEDENISRDQSDSLFLESTGASLAWKHQWTPKISSRLLGVHTDYHYDYDYEVTTKGKGTPDKSGIKKSAITEQQLHLLNTYQTSAAHTWKMGYQLIRYDAGFQIDKAAGENAQTNRLSSLKSNIQVLYGTFNSAKEKPLGLNAGLRANYFEKEKKAYLAPRLFFWYKPNRTLNFSIAAGRYFQYLSQVVEIEGDRSSIETPVWVLAGEKEVPVLKADQLQLGGIFQKKSWLLEIQLYAKQIDGLTSLATGFDDDLGGRFHIGQARIRGLDLLLKKRWKSYRSWISYSLSKVDHRFDTFFDPEFSAPNDQPHKLHWVHLWDLNQWQFSLGWKLKSGSPYSNINFFTIRSNLNEMGPKEIIFPDTKRFNSERLPLQHQMDLSVSYHYLPKKTDRWKAVFGLSVFNLYNQNNLYKRDFFMAIQSVGLPQLRYLNKADMGITPNVMMRIEW